ncbi:MAG: pilus assembly FimT family protein [Candidatus Acidiferrales bacterium]
MKLSKSDNFIKFRTPSQPSAGFTLLEMLLVVLVGMVMTAIAIPVLSRAMANMRINSAVSQFSGAIQSTRFRAIKDSQPYTFVLTTPANTYVVSNTVNPAPTTVPLPSYITITGGSGSPFTYTLCPNGIVYGAGGCSPNPNQPPALSFTYQGRQINVAVSDVGNVTTTTIQ